MFLGSWRRERFILSTLRRLSKQRVVAVMQPGNAWLIERGVGHDDETEAALRTCHLRGWVELLVDAIPRGTVSRGRDLPSIEQMIAKHGPIYRLTDSGWATIKRSHQWVIASWLVALASLISSVVAILISRLSI